MTKLDFIPTKPSVNPCHQSMYFFYQLVAALCSAFSPLWCRLVNLGKQIISLNLWLPADRRIKLMWAQSAKYLYGNTFGRAFFFSCIIPQFGRQTTANCVSSQVFPVMFLQPSSGVVNEYKTLNLNMGKTGLSWIYPDLASQRCLSAKIVFGLVM